VTVNSFININKTINNLSPQFNEHTKRPSPILVEIKLLAWDRHKKDTQWDPSVTL